MKRTPAVVIGALVGCALLVLWAVVAWARFVADFWPLDNSRIGPNLVASGVQALLVTLALVLLWPPLRRLVHAELDHLHSKIDHATDVLHHVVRHSRSVPNEIEGVHIDERRPARGRS